MTTFTLNPHYVEVITSYIQTCQDGHFLINDSITYTKYKYWIKWDSITYKTHSHFFIRKSLNIISPIACNLMIGSNKQGRAQWLGQYINNITQGNPWALIEPLNLNANSNKNGQGNYWGLLPIRRQWMNTRFRRN